MPIGVSGRPPSGQHKSTGTDFLTPPDLLAALGALKSTANGWQLGTDPYDLDPCASVRMPWPTAKVMHTKHEDGMAQTWAKGSAVWLNPPYGNELSAWIARLASHGTGTALVYARTDTAWFRTHVWDKASAVYFFSGRLWFHRPVTGHQLHHNSGGPMCLACYGVKSVKRAKRLLDSPYPGTLVSLRA